ncbi:tetratricopeptide repeat protein [Archangium violaceum]|uniref:tetratricopeptide repeat protein n=1 Tax=Archangium violaceum TaxID=83451 RepID=UPI002B318590|nr:tetratricopeptide repeat protein [Archangium violaceum]
MSPRHLHLLVLVLFAPRLAWADAQSIQLYERGDYEAAAESFTRVLADPRRSSQELGEARVYLAASLHALGRTEEAREQLEVLARDYPEQRVDAVLFPPELVALAEAIRQRVDAEREYARKEAERERLAREEVLRRPPPPAPPPPAYLRPEVLGLYEALGRQVTLGVGLSYHQGLLEGSARVLLNGDPTSSPPRVIPPTFQFQGGVLLGRGAFRPHLGLQAILPLGAQGYGGGAVAGLRFSLPKGFVAFVDVGVERFFFTADETYRKLALTTQAGLGFDLRLPSGK